MPGVNLRSQTSNIMKNKVAAFLEVVDSNPELQKKFTALKQETGENLLKALVKLSAEAGTPVSLEEWSACRAELQPSDALSDRELETVSGGVFLKKIGDALHNKLSQLSQLFD